MNDKDNPLEPFKRATIATMRALAQNDELEVTFGHGTPAASGNRIRVPLPAIGSTDAQINVVRGVGDEFALRLRYHDERIYKRRAPREGPAEEMFRWVEDARIASIGSLRMQGVAQNLDASLEAQCLEAAFDTITTETEAPLSVAVGLLVREHLTGRELPPSAENVVKHWRDFVESRAATFRGEPCEEQVHAIARPAT